MLADWPAWAHPVVAGAWQGAGIEHLWSHQREMADLLWDGSHVAISTGTASGKTLGYLLPTLSELVTGASAVTGRGATALYVAPTKALAADQLTRVTQLALPSLRAAVYDGDTPVDERRWIREHAAYMLTNPDMIHHGILPNHERWAPFLRALRYVIVDESHVYKGVFGSHVAAVLRRLARVARRYGSEPRFAFASATIGDPAGHGERLIGMPVRAVTADGSPRAGVTFALCEPPVVGPPGAERRRSTLTETAELLARSVAAGAQTLAFARSRVAVEVVAAAAARRLSGGLSGGMSGGISEGTAGRLAADPGAGAVDGHEGVSSIAAYRGGYLPEERRALERDLRSGAIRGLAATNALELGIDISGLDAVVLAGWPGTHASLWQEAGRAGRSGQEALVVFVAADDPLDAFVVANPATVFARPIDAVVLDPENPYVLGPHLACAAAEVPLTRDDVRWFGPSMPELAGQLVTSGVLRRRPGGWFWAEPTRPTDALSLRGIGSIVQIVESRTGRVLGTVDDASADVHVHPGAVHIHQGETWVVRALDREAGTAEVVRGDPGWTTHPASVSTFEILSDDLPEGHSEADSQGHPDRHWDARDGAGGAGPVSGVHKAFGTVRVTRRVTRYQRRLPSGDIIGEHLLDMPERILQTKAVWWTVEDELLRSLGIDPPALPGALHGAEHAAIGVLPLFASADRWDIGGVSTVLHPGTGRATIMVYDGYPGGAGFAERGYAVAADWLAATRDVVASCGCAAGCPSCVMSPKCGNGNDPLDKAGAIEVLRLLAHSARLARPPI